MAQPASASLARQLGALFEGGSMAGLSDRQLLERFAAGHDPTGEAAFAAVVARHGPMVLGVCRQLLGDRHDAEDAFQAVFLVLARRARSIRDPDFLGTWLHGVALRTARKAGVGLARRRRTEEAAAGRRAEARPAVQAEHLVEREQAEALHGEIDRLPDSFRLPVVLCYFEGLSPDEAAARLRWPAGTLRSRLVRAREKLRRGLTRRGVVLSTAALSRRSASASVSSFLCELTTRAAIRFAARRAAGGARSASAAALARQVLRSMLIHKLKAPALSLVLLATLAIGTGYHALDAFAQSREVEPPGAPRVKATREEPHPADASRHSPGRMFVAGRVLDPDGKPVPGAVVDVTTRFRAPSLGVVDETTPWLTLLGQGWADGDGRFRFDAPRTASTRVFAVTALAAAPGYGLGWADLNPDAEQPAADIRLLPAQAVRVRLVDVTGAPAKGVEVRVLRIGRRTVDGRFDTAGMPGLPPVGVRTWPRPVTTDDQGRATLTGLGRGPGVNITLHVHDLRYARQELHVDSDRAADREVTLALEPARIVEGRVLAADTGQAMAGAALIIGAGGATRAGGGPRGSRPSRFRADDRGRFTANPFPGDSLRVTVYPPEDQPYPVHQVAFAWAKGAVRTDLDIHVPRGVLIRGKVTEAGTNRPLADSSIYFIPVQRRGERVVASSEALVASKDDGSFQVAVPPGKGHLLVFGPTPDYVLREIGSNALQADRPGGTRFRVHAVIPYEVKAGDPPREVAAALRRGVTIRGRVEGPGGRTVTDASIITTLRVEVTRPFWSPSNPVEVRDGSFELHGLAPDASSRIFVLDAEHEWGATVEVSGRQAGEGLTIRLEPCGRARARFVDPQGRPVARPKALFQFVATPGPSAYDRRNNQDRDRLTSDADFLANVDRKHYANDPPTDAEGRITLISLIPGALYRISDMSTFNVAEKGAQVRKEFTVKPGETVDLGDILIEKPSS